MPGPSVLLSAAGGNVISNSAEIINSAFNNVLKFWNPTYAISYSVTHFV